MSTTTMYSGTPPTTRFGGVSYLFTVPILFILVIAIVSLVWYFYNRHRRSIVYDHELYVDEEIGINEATLCCYPVLLYSQAKLDNKDTTSYCSICLSDYKDPDMLRLLPDCRHVFHLNCVDPWLRLHPTCPICRNSPLPSPLSTPTPLSQAAPLAYHLRNYPS